MVWLVHAQPSPTMKYSHSGDGALLGKTVGEMLGGTTVGLIDGLTVGGFVGTSDGR